MTLRLACLALGAFAVGTGNFVFVGVLDALAADLAVPVSSAGQLTTVFAVAYALAAPVLVAATAGLARRLVLLAALALFAAANVAMALAPSLTLLLVLRVAAAAGAALYMPVAMGVAVQLVEPAYRGRAMSIVLLGLTFAFLVGIPAGTWIGSWLGWRATFATAAAVAGVATAAVAAVTPALAGAASRGLRGIGVAARPGVSALLTVTTLAFVAVFCINAFVGPVLTRATGLGGAGIGALQVALGVGGVIGVPIGGWLADRGHSAGAAVGILVVIAAAQAVFTLVLGVPGWAGTAAAIAACGGALALASGALFALGPIQQERLLTVAGDERDIVLSLNASALFLGQGLGAALGGASIALLGFAANGLIGSTVALAAITLAVLGRRWRARA